jgi:hypothetical protein
MQWTVRYFRNKSQTWVRQPGTGTGVAHNYNIPFGTGISSTYIPSVGAISYSKRKQAMWQDLMIKADIIFMRSNPAYQSPL